MDSLSIKLQHIEQTFNGKEILTIPQLSVYQNDRIGIVGENGAGKSTLLKIIQGELVPDKGQIQREISFNYFSQIPDSYQQNNVENIDGAMLSRFKIPQTNTEVLSGGEASKFRLVQTLSSYPAGLLLDEPTTHLDHTSRQLLVEELQYYYGTLIFVSHDRSFLNQLATKIWEIKAGRVTEYIGNYQAYQDQKNIVALEQEKMNEKYIKEKKRLDDAIIRKKAQAQRAEKVSAKQQQQNVRPDRLSSSKQKDTVQKNIQKSAKAMTSRLNQLEKVKPVEKQRQIIFPPIKQLELHNKTPIRGTQVTLVRDNRTLLNKADFQFSLGKKIAIVGDNGAGKSTLLNHIVSNGEGITVSKKAQFSVYQQMSYQFLDDQSILHYLMTQTEYKEALVRSILNNLGFSQTDINKPLRKISGGEATRIALAEVFIRPANILILDEPTNFIDLNTIEAVEQLMKSYVGTVLFTSHDSYFVERIADEIYQIDQEQLTLLT